MNEIVELVQINGNFCLTPHSANYRLMFNFSHFIRRFLFIYYACLLCAGGQFFIVVGAIEIL